MKKFKIKPSLVVLNVFILLVLLITALISINAAGVEYVILNMATIVWFFAQLDPTTDSKLTENPWLFLTVVFWIVAIIGTFVYLVVNLTEVFKEIGKRIDDKFGN